ncbi:MAG: hypothetical protein ACRENJ_03870 [Candidatus Eiseniibacteriota bacterium]
MDSGAVLLLNVHQWPRHRRLAMCGKANKQYRHGRYTNKRRWRLEKPLNQAMAQLTALQMRNFKARISRLPNGTREQADAAFDRLGESFPGRWALPDPRRPETRPSWYVPRRAWAICARWLRLWREFQRLVFWGASLISPPMQTPYGRGETRPLDRGLSSEQRGLEERKRTELGRFRAWCARAGLELEPMT